MAEMKSRLRLQDGSFKDVVAKPHKKLTQTERDKKVATDFDAKLREQEPKKEAKAEPKK